MNPNDRMKKEEYENNGKTQDKVIKLAKRKHYEEKIVNSKNELKALWKLVKTKGFTDSGNGIKEIQSEHDHSIQDPQSIANEFNEYFSQIGKNLADKMKRAEPLSCRKVTPKDSFFLTPVTENFHKGFPLSIYHQNVRGLRTKSDILFSRVISENDDIIALSETWFCQGCCDDASVSKFTSRTCYSKSKFPKWFSNDLIHKIKRRNKLYTKIVKCEAAQAERKEFRVLRSIISSQTESEYYDYKSDLKRNLNNDPNNFWSCIRSKSNLNGILDRMIHGDISFNNPESISDAFASYFASVYVSHDCGDLGTEPSKWGYFTFPHFTRDDVVEAIKKNEIEENCWGGCCALLSI
ncbi:hypothetical protein WA026_004290 [Henosepilachna vigintioctopunctata]|uniref:Uncharacterized protein n=1 Tax=Henosepilachna vigintioctopunctata TaxID=420089 RepID=A0AAW1V9V4_9CUCU